MRACHECRAALPLAANLNPSVLLRDILQHVPDIRDQYLKLKNEVKLLQEHRQKLIEFALTDPFTDPISDLKISSLDISSSSSMKLSKAIEPLTLVKEEISKAVDTTAESAESKKKKKKAKKKKNTGQDDSDGDIDELSSWNLTPPPNTFTSTSAASPIALPAFTSASFVPAATASARSTSASAPLPSTASASATKNSTASAKSAPPVTSTIPPKRESIGPPLPPLVGSDSDMPSLADESTDSDDDVLPAPAITARSNPARPAKAAAKGKR